MMTERVRIQYKLEIGTVIWKQIEQRLHNDCRGIYVFDNKNMNEIQSDIETLGHGELSSAASGEFDKRNLEHGT